MENKQALISFEEQMKKKNEEVVTRANSLVIGDQASFDNAAVFLKTFVALKKEVIEHHKPIIKSAYETHKTAKAQEAIHKVPLEEAEKIVKQKMSTYYSEQERIKAKEAAEETAKQNKIEEENRLAQAESLEDAGKSEEAEQVLSQQSNVVVQKEKPVVTSSVTFKKKWKWNLIDKNLLPKEYLKVDEVALNGVVSGTKGAIKIPGVDIYFENVACNR